MLYSNNTSSSNHHHHHHLSRGIAVCISMENGISNAYIKYIMQKKKFLTIHRWVLVAAAVATGGAGSCGECNFELVASSGASVLMSTQNIFYFPYVAKWCIKLLRALVNCPCSVDRVYGARFFNCCSLYNGLSAVVFFVLVLKKKNRLGSQYANSISLESIEKLDLYTIKSWL